jgi:hypothetical protein
MLARLAMAHCAAVKGVEVEVLTRLKCGVISRIDTVSRRRSRSPSSSSLHNCDSAFLLRSLC